jgi:DNA-binding transcriptional ArsR family regulator
MPTLDSTFAALSDPTRRAILARLALGETTVMELARPFEMTQPAISRHLKVLEVAGLIVRRVEGSKRPARLAPHAIAKIDQWLSILRNPAPWAPDIGPSPQPPHRQRRPRELSTDH